LPVGARGGVRVGATYTTVWMVSWILKAVPLGEGVALENEHFPSGGKLLPAEVTQARLTCWPVNPLRGLTRIV